MPFTVIDIGVRELNEQTIEEAIDTLISHLEPQWLASLPDEEEKVAEMAFFLEDMVLTVPFCLLFKSRGLLKKGTTQIDHFLSKDKTFDWMLSLGGYGVCARGVPA